ncbi:tetratricopeptide repeat protein [bacterium]|nr:tetratricopeptide repeat protein [bacterium]
MYIDINQQLKQASELQLSGELVSAEAIYQNILEHIPLHPIASHNLGRIKASSGDHEAALRLIKISIIEEPTSATFLTSYIEILITQNDIKNAKKYLKKAKKIGLSPLVISALKTKMRLINMNEAPKKINNSEFPSQQLLEKIAYAYNSGDQHTAKQLAVSTSNQYPNHPFAWKILSIIYHKRLQFEEAVVAAERALLLDANDHQVHCHLGSILLSLNRLKDSEHHFKTSIQLAPNDITAHNNLGIVLQRMGKLAESKSILLESISLSDNNLNGYNNLGSVSLDLGELEQAKHYFKRAISLGPDYPEAYNNLGSVFNSLGDLDKAKDYFKKAIKLRPQYISALYNLGIVFERSKQPNDALEIYKNVYALSPEHDYLLGAIVHLKMQLAIWDNHQREVDIIISGILDGQKICTPFAIQALIDIPKIQLKASQIYWNSQYQTAVKLPSLPAYKKHSKIKIGYFSPDFCNHPVSHLTADLYKQHDRERFEIHAFSHGIGKNDDFTDRIKSNVDYFHEVSQFSDEAIVTLSRTLEIDIAIDLAGYTDGCRARIFAMAVAPIQIGYIGFLGTMGSNSYDYIISDSVTINEKNKQYYSENIIYLPSYQVNDSQPVPVDKVGSKRFFDIPEDVFVFCCFNAVYKITPSTFDSWARILLKVDSSILMLYCDNEKAIENLKREIAERDIDPKRLMFVGRSDRAEYLARYTFVDLFLDTLPYNSGATASDALRMGCPIVTCMGESLASRVCGSLLKSAGIPELISTSYEEYEKIAIDISNDPKKLRIVKEKLNYAKFSSQLFDSRLFASRLEQAFLLMQAKHEQQEVLKDIYIE